MTKQRGTEKTIYLDNNIKDELVVSNKTAKQTGFCPQLQLVLRLQCTRFVLSR